MPHISYKDISFKSASLTLIHQANRIIEEYSRQGFQLTLRQLYYQFVSRAIIENNVRSYKNLGNIINDARLAGLVDWNAIVDRTRNLVRPSTWESPAEIVRSCVNNYQEDLWDYQQRFRPEVWIEKDALVGVIEGICDDLRIPYFSCRGFTSQSEMWQAAQRMKEVSYRGQATVILHFGDHDPSGMDMSRDIEERLTMFGLEQDDFQFRRMALNWEQVKKYNPPPNPAKSTDSRFREYRKKFGNESWELDALDPSVISDLIEKAVEEYRDDDLWAEAKALEDKSIKRLAGIYAELSKEKP